MSPPDRAGFRGGQSGDFPWHTGSGDGLGGGWATVLVLLFRKLSEMIVNTCEIKHNGSLMGH